MISRPLAGFRYISFGDPSLHACEVVCLGAPFSKLVVKLCSTPKTTYYPSFEFLSSGLRSCRGQLELLQLLAEATKSESVSPKNAVGGNQSVDSSSTRLSTLGCWV